MQNNWSTVFFFKNSLDAWRIRNTTNPWIRSCFDYFYISFLSVQRKFLFHFRLKKESWPIPWDYYGRSGNVFVLTIFSSVFTRTLHYSFAPSSNRLVDKSFGNERDKTLFQKPTTRRLNTFTHCFFNTFQHYCLPSTYLSFPIHHVSFQGILSMPY